MKIPQRGARLAPAFVTIALFALTACTDSSSRVEPGGGADLIAGAESALATVVGTIDSLGKVDRHAFAAQLSIEQVVGRADSGFVTDVLTAGTAEVRITWEELATQRPARLRRGDRIVVALAPLPPASIWRTRFPRAGRDEKVFAIAGKGEAFLRHPDESSLDSLHRYLSLAPEVRRASEGATRLAHLVAAGGDLPLSALAALRQTEDLDHRLTAEASQQLTLALRDRKRPLEHRRAVLELIRDRQLTSLLPTLRELTGADHDLQPEVWAAIDRLSGGLSQAEAGALLASDDAATRAAGARLARHSDFTARLTTLIRSDPEPEVRKAAIESLIAIGGTTVADQIVPALGDSDPQVRLAAAGALASQGDAIVPRLEAVANGADAQNAIGAILALNQAGGPGRAALERIAVDHPDETIRNLALLALGRLESHRH